MRNKGKQQSGGINLPINDQIRHREVMLIDDESGHRGLIGRDEALAMAQERQLDLVLVAPLANPPVARVLDYGKYRYEQERALRKNKQQRKTLELKEIRLTARMDDHDRDQRVKRAQGFLTDGHRLHLSMRFRGRENLFREKGMAILKNFADQLNQQFETPARTAGNTVSVNLIPKQKKDES